MSSHLELHLVEMLGLCSGESIGILVDSQQSFDLLRARIAQEERVKIVLGPDLSGDLGGMVLGCYIPNQEWDASKIRGVDELIVLGDIENLRYRMILNCVFRGVSRLIYSDEGDSGGLPFFSVSRRPASVFLERLLESCRSASKPLPKTATATAGGEGAPLLGNPDGKDWRGMLPMVAEKMRPGAEEDGSILLYNNSLGWGGAERQISVLLTNMKGTKVQILCTDLSSFEDRNFFLPTLEASDVEVAELDEFLSVHEEAGHQFREEGGELLEKLHDFRGDIRERVFKLWLALKIIQPKLVHPWQDQTNIEVGIAAVLAGVPGVLMSGRNVAPHRFPYHLEYMKECYVELLKIKGVYLLNNSHAGAKDYEEWLGLKPGVIEVVHNAVDTEYLAESGDRKASDSSTRVISGVFRFYPEKRPLLWMEVAKLVYAAEPNSRFELAGTGPLLENAKEYARENGLEDVVTFLGSTREVKELLDRSDCLLLVSDREGLPNVLLEAQSMGVPVVTSDAGGAAETLVDSVSGVVVKSDEAEDYAKALLQALRDQEWAAKAREVARENVEENFRVEVALDRLQEVYAKVLSS